MVQCKECHITFDSDKSFHSHLRKHKLKIKDYYERHYPKSCLFSGKKLQWKDGDTLATYIGRDFIDKGALGLYFKDNSNLEAKRSLLLTYFEDSCKRHGIVPSQIELASLPLSPNYLIFREFFNIPELISEKGFRFQYFHDIDYAKKLSLPKVNLSDFTINVDSREQQPYRFFSSIKGKIDSGDYCLAGNLFNGVVVERKSVSDFGGTVVGGNERFRRELDRVRESGRYLIVLVEFNIHDLYKHKFYGYSSPAFVAHNMRDILRDYRDCCQFVFGIDRESCVKYVVEFLLYGQQCRQTDLQLYVDYQKSQFRVDEFSKEDLMRLYDNS